jgi:amino acid transporter
MIRARVHNTARQLYKIVTFSVVATLALLQLHGGGSTLLLCVFLMFPSYFLSAVSLFRRRVDTIEMPPRLLHNVI